MTTKFVKNQQSILAETDPNDWRDGVSTGVWDNVKARTARTLREDLFSSVFLNAAKEVSREDNILNSAETLQGMVRRGEVAGDDVSHLLRASDGGFTPPRFDEQKVDDFLEVTYPEVEFEKTAVRLERNQKIAQKLHAEEEDIFSRASTPAMVVSALSALPLYVADVPNAAAMLIGPWSQVGNATRLARLAAHPVGKYAAVGVEQLAVEGLTVPLVWENKKALGVPYGSKDVIFAMVGAPVAGMGLVGAVDVGKSISKQIKQIKASPAAATTEGQEALNAMGHVAAEVEIARQSGRPLGELLDDTDGMLTEMMTPTKARRVSDPEEFPEIRGYDDEVKLQEDYDKLMAERSGKAAPVGDEAAEVEYKYNDPVMEDFDTKLDRLKMARECYGG